MSMTDWAKNEVALACAREAPNRKDGEWDYGCACYESALKAFESLMDDEHSGASFGFTKGILTRLMESKPLTPIEDTPDMWNLISHEGYETCYQCKRMSALFKYVDDHGNVRYSDVRRDYCYNVENSGSTFHNGLAARLIDEHFPITMPYYPPVGYYAMATEEFLTDRKNGDFDTVGYFFIRTPDAQIVPVNKFYAEIDGVMREISHLEYEQRRVMHKEREQRERQAQEATQNE